MSEQEYINDHASELRSIESNINYTIESLDMPEVYASINESSSEDSIPFEPVKLFISGAEVLPTPYDEIFGNRSVLKLEVLMQDVLKEPPAKKKILFSDVFKCMSIESNPDIRRIKDIVVNMGTSYFNKQSELHGNLIMSWYSAHTGRTDFKLEPRIWQKLGFESEDLSSNGLHSRGVPLVLLHFLYFKAKAPECMQKYQQACLNPNTSGCLVSTSLTILKETLNLFESKKLSRILEESNESPLAFFLNFHSGVIILWCQFFESALTKTNIQKILKKTLKNLNDDMAIRLFKIQVKDLNNP
jgi:ELMO/CED-12 family